MTSWRKTAWCTRCAAERPIRKATVGKDRGRYCCVTCGERVLMPSKYGNKPVRSRHSGRLIHSKKEAAWEPTLLALQNSGHIRDLVPQGPLYRFTVFSSEPVEELLSAVHALLARPHREHRLVNAVNAVERSRVAVPGSYRPDWTFYDSEANGGAFHVHDIKGRRTDKFRRDEALMLACHGLVVETPEPGGIQQRARGAGIHGRGTGSRLAGGR